MDLRRRALTALAGQLGHPRGLPGRLVGRRLDRANAGAVRAAAEALTAPPNAVLADLGFGGGVGLERLLRQVAGTGHVHGVEVSTAMLSAAGRRFRREIDAGHLSLHHAPIEALPLPAGSVEGAITVNTLYFLPDLTGAFTECARVLAPGGRLVVGIGDPDAMARLPVTATGFLLRPVVEVSRALNDAGLTTVEHRRLGAGADAGHLLVTTRSADEDTEPGPPLA